ncbi:MAG: AAA family ATPase, partial [Firmicutes bacterium]|nr:AAA family ATPase [Bacillota bacterium]
MQNRFNTIDGETLMTKPLAPIRFVADSFIPQGLHILAGAPKTGKSWLALWLCLQIAKGENVWNFKTEKGTTLYLCLEDSENRIQSRLFDVTDDAPNNAHFTVTSNTIGDGLSE